MAAEVPKQAIILRSLDGDEFVLEASVASNSSVMLKNIIEDGCAESAIPLSNVHSSVLANVIEFWKRHSSSSGSSADDVDALKAWDEDFVKMMERDEFFGVTAAANYLDSKPLLDLLCGAIAKNMEGMLVDEVRAYFNIENDFTEEEEAKIRKENAWAFE